MKLSDSKLQTYKDCQLKYFYKYECRLEVAEEAEASHDRAFGDGIHKALEALYKGESMDGAIKAFRERYPKQLDIEDLAKTPENGEKLIRAYWDTYKAQLPDWNILSVEELAEAELVNGLTFRVKLDLVAENKKYGGVYGFDWKTTGKKLDYAYWGQWSPSSQVSAYTEYINKKYGGCSGFYIDAMSFGHRQRMYKGEPAGFHYRLERQMFNRTPEQIEDWKRSEEWVARQIEESVKGQRFGMNTSACRFCEFKPICQAGWRWEEDRDLILCQYNVRSTNEAHDKGGVVK